MDHAHIIGIIPARMASSRFEGKPLAPIAGVPMVGHCWFRSKMSRTLDEVYIATCDEPIMQYATRIGAPAIMTADSHTRASERTSEALEHIERHTGKRVDIVVMIQGDEPLLRPEMIDEALSPMLVDESIRVVNLMAAINSTQEHDDINEIKVVVDQNDFALYFSRVAIPSRRNGSEQVRKLKQVCIIPFRRDFLIKFNELEPTPLEIAESIDMLRVLEHGYRVKMVETRHPMHSVDTPDDLAHVEPIMAADDLLPEYVAP